MRTNETKRAEANERQAKSNTLTYEQRLEKLDAGGHTAKKERSRLNRALNLEAKLKEQRDGTSDELNCPRCDAGYLEKCDPASCETARRDEAYHER